MAVTPADAPATPVAIDVDHTVNSFVGYADRLANWLTDLSKALLSPVSGWQALAVIAILAIAYVCARYPARALAEISGRHASVPMLQRLYRSLSKLCWPIIAVVLLLIVGAVWRSLGLNAEILRVATSLLSALIAVQFLAYNMRAGFWSRLFAITAWLISALYILHLFDPFISFLDSSAITVAGSRISALGLITSLIAVVLALWVGRLAGDAAQSRLRDSSNLNPSMAGLLGQVAKATFMIVAIIVALYAAGINLTALTVFTGALGVGIGFGLQAIFSNFISGVIILMEKSVKVGDFIELPTGVTGLVTEINIRSTLVTTNDNVDILVPNEEFIKAQVINWTLRDSRRRQRIPMAPTRNWSERPAWRLRRRSIGPLTTAPAACRRYGWSDLAIRAWISNLSSG